MSDSELFILMTTGVTFGLTVLGLFYRVFREKQRLVGRYAYLKAVMKKHEQMRAMLDVEEGEDAEGVATVMPEGAESPADDNSMPMVEAVPQADPGGPMAAAGV